MSIEKVLETVEQIEQSQVAKIAEAKEAIEKEVAEKVNGRRLSLRRDNVQGE